MTALPLSDTTRRVGRKMLWPDKMIAPLKEGRLARIDAILRPGETRTDFVREAIDQALAKREREARRKG